VRSQLATKLEFFQLKICRKQANLVQQMKKLSTDWKKKLARFCEKLQVEPGSYDNEVQMRIKALTTEELLALILDGSEILLSICRELAVKAPRDESV
jgi:hypothetical protein